MVHESPADVVSRLASHRCSIAVIGRRQVTSDIPEHREWALSTERPPEAAAAPAVDGALAAAAAGARDTHEERAAMGRALLPRLQGYDVSQLACVL